jgi:hypothetical protein
MHFLTSLIIFTGFVFVLCFGLIQVIWDLSKISAHASPHAVHATWRTSEEDGHAKANESSSAADLSDTL